jgi:hypothetical protein
VRPLTERDLEYPDPLRLDAEIARAARSLMRFRRRLGEGEGYDDDPFFTTRLIASRSAFTAVREMPADDPLRESLLRWVYRLSEARINQATTIRIAAELRMAEHVATEPERVRTTLSALMGRALSEPKRRQGWLTSYVASADTLGAAVAVLWERRAEVAARLGLSGPDVIEGAGADVHAAAERWLARTDDAFASVISGQKSLSGVVSIALADDLPGEFPRHLLPRTIQDFFRDSDLLRSVELDPGPLPESLAPTSLLRAFARVFAAWIDASAPADQPFVIAHDPYGLRRREYGALFGRLPFEASFARKKLAVDGSKAKDYERKLGAALLTTSRTLALRVLLRRSALEGRKSFGQAFESGTERVLGVALRPMAAGAILRLTDDDTQRFAGSLLAASRARVLRDVHDDDWYRNPRAVEQLRDEARFPPVPTTTDEALTAGSDALFASLTNGM